MGKKKPKYSVIEEQVRNAVPIDPEEMNFILALAGAAGSYRMPEKEPVGRPFQLDMGDEVQTLSFTDIPFNRAMFAIMKHCGDDERKCMSAFWRFMALATVYKDERFRRFSRPVDGENAIEISSVIGHVAGILPLNKRGRFNLDQFFAKAEELTRTYQAEGNLQSLPLHNKNS